MHIVQYKGFSITCLPKLDMFRVSKDNVPLFTAYSMVGAKARIDRLIKR